MSISSQSSKYSLLREVHCHIHKLEEAIREIGLARKHLKRSALEVKSDIQTTVTQQLEVLREREMYLLRQVDALEQCKDATLQDQEDQLHEALGGLNNILQLNEGNSAKHLSETLDKLKNVDLHPKETSHLAFKADVSAVNDCINSFGAVDVQRLQLSSLFGQEPSAMSLPRAFEDYDDDEHHILHRDLTDQIGDHRQISVTIPRLSKKPEDWLLLPSNQLQVPQISAPVSPKFAPFRSTTLAGWLDNHDVMTRSMSSAASIHQWLCDIQNQGEAEEEAEATFEVISPTASNPPPSSTKESSIEILDMEEIQPEIMSTPNIGPTISAVSQDKPVLQYFQEITVEPSDRWLLSREAPDSSADFCEDVLSYFRQSSKDTKDWLMNFTKKCDGAGDCSPCAAVTRTFDIENLDKLVCVQDPLSYFSTLTSDPASWLMRAHKDEDGDLDETEEGVTAVCKANEPCESFYKCLADENCCSALEKPSADAHFGYFDAVRRQEEQMWLLPGNRQEENSPVDEMVLPVSSVQDKWLQTSSVLPEVDAPKPGMFNQILNTADSLWLASTQNSVPCTVNKPEDDIKAKSYKINLVEQTKSESTVDSMSDWLFSKKLSGISLSDNKNMKKEKVEAKTISWLLQSSQEKGIANKESLRYSYGKHAELPECEDEPPTEAPSPSKHLFSCFQTKRTDNNTWLCNDAMMVD